LKQVQTLVTSACAGMDRLSGPCILTDKRLPDCEAQRVVQVGSEIVLERRRNLETPHETVIKDQGMIDTWYGFAGHGKTKSVHQFLLIYRSSSSSGSGASTAYKPTSEGGNRGVRRSTHLLKVCLVHSHQLRVNSHLRGLKCRACYEI